MKLMQEWAQLDDAAPIGIDKTLTLMKRSEWVRGWRWKCLCIWVERARQREFQSLEFMGINVLANKVVQYLIKLKSKKRVTKAWGSRRTEGCYCKTCEGGKRGECFKP